MITHAAGTTALAATPHLDEEIIDYRANGPELMKSVGEVEVATRIAAMSDSGLFGEVKLCAGIIGATDPLSGFNTWWMASPPFSSSQLAGEWKPYVETCIEAFGEDRCMFESDFPYVFGVCSYPVLWNAYKLITVGCSREERASLFSDTAKKVYRLDLGVQR